MQKYLVVARSYWARQKTTKSRELLCLCMYMTMRMIVLTCEIVTFSIRPRNSGARPTVPGKRMESTFCGFDPGDQPIDLEEV